MYCTKCGSQFDGQSKFCINCGHPRPESYSKNKTSDEQLLYVITKIRSSGVASIKYWSIAFTDKAIYFCDMGSNYLPLGLGAIEDLRLGSKLKNNNTNIQAVLDKSKKYYKVDNASVNNIETRKGFFINKITLHNTEAGEVSIKIKGKQFKEFSDQIQKIK